YTIFALYNYQMFQQHVLSGRDVTLSCNYSGNVRNLQWYRQYPGSKPENIIFYTESKSQSEPKLRLYAVADKGIKRMNLSIYSTELDDSALYYCALEPTVTGNTTALYKNRQSGHTVLTKHYQQYFKTVYFPHTCTLL
uniref:T-cell receptor alpha/delta variable 3.0.3 n=1 Tax=Sinocyclocheilus grahami TaxID=75366 RepID=A0A672PZW0_SINGR